MDHDEQIRRIVDRFIEARHTENAVSESQLLAAHPEFLAELKDELQKLKLLEGAFESSLSDGTARKEDLSKDEKASDLLIRCPHCSESKSVASDTPWTDLTCDSCGKGFSLVLDSERFAISEIGHFSMLRRLGMGSFGTVWQAYDTVLDRVVAVKIPRRSLSSDESEQFFREARAAAQLRHANIVSVHEIGQSEGRCFIVSDFIDGHSLAHWLDEHRLTSRESAELICKLASALQHAHDAGVIHRDLKPGNIMMDLEHQPHIMDFGLAKRQVGEVTMTHDGQLVGTPAYMSPEQARGQAHASDAKTDIYALGVILYELLTRELPFRGNVQMMIQQVLNEEPASPRKLNQAIPVDLETICMKCLEKEPNRRFATARDLNDELNRFLQNRPIQTRPVGPIGKIWKWTKRNPTIAAMAAGIVLLIAGGASGVTYYAMEAREASRRESDVNQAHKRTGLQVVNRLQAALRDNDAPDIYKQFYDAQLEQIKLTFESKPNEARTSLSNFPEDLRDQRWNLLNELFRGEAAASVVQLKNSKPLESASLTSNGDLVIAKIDESVVVFDAKSGEEIRRIAGVNQPRMSLLNREKWLASFGSEHSIDLFSIDTGDRIALLSINDSAKCVAYTSANQYLIAGGADHHISVWNAATDFQLIEKKGFRHNHVFDVDLTPNEVFMVTVSDTKMTQWNLRNLSKVLVPFRLPHKSDIKGCSLAPCSERFCTFSEDLLYISYLFGASGKTRVPVQIKHGAESVQFSPSGEFLLITTALNEVKILRTNSVGQPDLIAKPKSPIVDVRFDLAGTQTLVLTSDGQLRRIGMAK